ncbi:uncharacterized protein LOC118435898 [Folsomia candida]|nr:uncharacterized protein LOC118435898 [Folsomia candida]
MCNGCRVVCWLNEKEIIKLVNAQGDMERKLLDKDSFGRSDTASEKKAKDKGKPETPPYSLKVPATPRIENTTGEKFEKNLLLIGIGTGLGVPTMVFLILMAHPCLPPFLGSVFFTYVGKKRCITLGWWSYWGHGLLNFWMHLDMVLGFVFTMFGLFFLSTCLLHDYLEVLNSNFPLIKTGKIDSVSLSPLRGYRYLQILEKQVNECFRRHYFPLFLGGMTALTIFCLHACIRLPGKIPMPGFSYFPMVAFDGVVSLLIMTTRAANVREKSISMIRSWSNCQTIKRKHLVKKMTKSFVPLKVQLGGGFVDKLTPLLILNFTVSQVVSLLLLRS